MSAALNKIVPRTITVPQTTATGPASDGCSEPVYVGDLTGITGPVVAVSQSGTNTTGTFQVQGSMDKLTWTTVGADISAAANRALAIDYVWVRTKCTVNVSGAANVFGAIVAGRPARV